MKKATTFMSMSLVKKQMFLVGVFLCTSLFMSASSKEYAVTDVALFKTDLQSNNVDTFILSESGVYDLPDYCRTYNDFVVIAKEGLPTRPVITRSTNATVNGDLFRQWRVAVQATFIGIEFDLSGGTEPTMLWYDFTNGETQSLDLKLIDCYIHSGTASQGVVRVNTKNSSVTMDNCLVSDCGDAFLYFYIPSVDYGEVNITNTTFSNVTGDVIYYRTASGAYGNMNNITFDHCTFKNIGDEIMSYDIGFVQEGAEAIITNSVLVDVEKISKDGISLSDYNYLDVNTASPIITETNTFITPPSFAASPDTFRITNTSDFICADGSYAGDLNWYNVTGISLDQEVLTVNVGGNSTLSATVAPINAIDQTFTWGSTDEAVATVVDGVVSGISAGTAKIFVETTEGAFTDTCVVTVSTATIVEDAVAASFSIFPNPSAGIFSVNMSKSATFDYAIYSLNGGVVREGTANGQLVLDLNNQDKGIYLLKLECEHDVFIKQLILK